MPRRLALFVPTLALALVLVGCGSDDDSSDDERDTTTTEEAAEPSTEPSEIEDDATTVPDETTEPDEETTTSAPDDSTTTTTAGEGGGEGDPEFCAAYGAFDEEADDLPDETLEEFQASVEFLRTGLTGVAEVAPDELTEDLDVIVATVEQVPEAIEGATTSEEAQQAALDLFEGQEFVDAIGRVETYFDERCPEANDDQADAEAGTPETVTPG